MTDHIGDVNKMVAAHPGVQGLAQLGRNVLARVTELERELAAAAAERDDQRASMTQHASKLYAAITQISNERDMLSELAQRRERQLSTVLYDVKILRARLAAIDNAPTVAWLSTDCIGERYLCFSTPDDSDPVVELIARPAKEAPPVTRPKFVRGEICGCQTRPTHYVGEIDCPWHKRGDGQPKEST